jgi:hypothetical protein
VREAGFQHINCFAHLLNLMIKRALGFFDSLCENYFKKNKFLFIESQT